MIFLDEDDDVVDNDNNNGNDPTRFLNAGIMLNKILRSGRSDVCMALLIFSRCAASSLFKRRVTNWVIGVIRAVLVREKHKKGWKYLSEEEKASG